MPEVYILKFIKDWGTYKVGQIIIKEAKLTRDTLVDLYKVAVEWTGEKPREAPKVKPATPLRAGTDIGQPTPEKCPNSAKPGTKGETISHEIIPLRPHRRGR